MIGRILDTHTLEGIPFYRVQDVNRPEKTYSVNARFVTPHCGVESDKIPATGFHTARIGMARGTVVLVNNFGANPLY